MSRIKIVAVSAGLWSPSKTTTLAREVLLSLSEGWTVEPKFIELGPIAAELGSTFHRESAQHAVAEALNAVEQADVLIAATPVFRGTFTGHFKHFFDLVQIEAIRGIPVVLAATGGGQKHCLIIEHSLRPLFGFLQAFTLPSGIYASDADFEGGKLIGSGVHARILAAKEELESLLSGRVRAPRWSQVEPIAEGRRTLQEERRAGVA